MTRRHPRRHQRRRNKQANAAAQQHAAPAAVYDAPDTAVAVSEVAISPIPSPDVPVEAVVVEPAIEAIPPSPPQLRQIAGLKLRNLHLAHGEYRRGDHQREKYASGRPRSPSTGAPPHRS